MFSTSPQNQRLMARSNDSIMSSPSHTQGNSPFGGSPVFLSPTESSVSPPAVRLSSLDQIKISHMRSNSSPVTDLAMHTTSWTGSQHTSPTNATQDDGYLAPSEVRAQSMAISPANIHVDIGSSTVPRSKRGMSVASNLLAQAVDERTASYRSSRSHSFGAKSLIETQKSAPEGDRFFPIHFPPAAATGQYEPQIRPLTQYASPPHPVLIQKPSPLLAARSGSCSDTPGVSSYILCLI